MYLRCVACWLLYFRGGGYLRIECTEYTGAYENGSNRGWKKFDSDELHNLNSLNTYQSDQPKDEVGVAQGTYWGEEKYIQGVGIKT